MVVVAKAIAKICARQQIPNLKEARAQKAGERVGARAKVVAAKDGAEKEKAVATTDGARAKAKGAVCMI